MSAPKFIQLTCAGTVSELRVNAARITAYYIDPEVPGTTVDVAGDKDGTGYVVAETPEQIDALLRMLASERWVDFPLHEQADRLEAARAALRRLSPEKP